jgi:hypothetical protein
LLASWRLGVKGKARPERQGSRHGWRLPPSSSPSCAVRPRPRHEPRPAALFRPRYVLGRNKGRGGRDPSSPASDPSIARAVRCQR